MATPTWLAATTGQATNAGQVNQFLGTHASTFVYAGVVQSQQTTAGTGAVNSNSLYIAQKFTTGASQTTLGRVVLTLAVTGSPTPMSVSLQANVSGAPSGTPLVTTLMPKEFLSGTPGTFGIPLPVTGLTAATQYWIVTNAIGDPSNYFSWSKSNQTSGASTSTNGTTWTAQSYGLLYQAIDATPTFPITHTWDDNGARWSVFVYNSTILPTAINEFTVGQTTAGYMLSVRNFTYTNGQITTMA